MTVVMPGSVDVDSLTSIGPIFIFCGYVPLLYHCFRFYISLLVLYHRYNCSLRLTFDLYPVVKYLPSLVTQFM